MLNGKFVWWVSGTMINLDGLTYSIYLLYYLFKPIPKLNYASVWYHLSYSKRRFGNWKKCTRGFGKHFLCTILDPRVVSLVRRVVLVPHIYSSLHVLREIQFTVDVENITIFLILSCSRSDSFPWTLIHRKHWSVYSTSPCRPLLQMLLILVNVAVSYFIIK